MADKNGLEGTEIETIDFLRSRLKEYRELLTAASGILLSTIDAGELPAEAVERFFERMAEHGIMEVKVPNED